MIILKILKSDFICREFTENINLLLRQLTEKAPQYSTKTLKKLLLNPFLVVVIAIDTSIKKIVGIGSIHFYYFLSQISASAGDIVVDEKYRRKGIAKLLNKKLIEIVKKRKSIYTKGKIPYISFSSHPSRKAANNLYVKMGCEKREVNVYRLYL